MYVATRVVSLKKRTAIMRARTWCNRPERCRTSFTDGLAGNRTVSRSGGGISFADECDIKDGNANKKFLFVCRYD